MPEISVIIPLYNKGSTISRAIDSVLSQTVKDFEVIIVDGGSSDGGPDIVRGYEDERLIMLEQSGRGVSQARNQGVDASESTLIAFLDADDEWHEDHLETILRLKRDHDEAAIFATAVIDVYDQEERVRRYTGMDEEPWEGLIPSYFHTAARNLPVITSAMGMKKDIFLEAGGFRVDLWRGEDTYLWAKVALNHPIAFSWHGKVLYHYDGENRITREVRSVEMHPFVIEALDSNFKHSVGQDVYDAVSEYVTKVMAEYISQNILAGDYDRSAKDFLRYLSMGRIRANHIHTIIKSLLHRFGLYTIP